MNVRFAWSDFLAIGALNALHVCGKQTSNELAIVGFDGIDMSGLTVPPITTIQQPIYRIGELAMTELLHRIENNVKTTKHYELDVELVIRESSMKSNKWSVNN